MERRTGGRLCIMLCGAKKIWDKDGAGTGPYPAEQVYIGALHKKCQAYARLFFPQWVILSAKHGFLFPEDRVPANYDTAFGTKSPDLISMAELRSQAVEKGLDQYGEIVMLGGKKFTKIIPEVFGTNIAVAYPLLGSKGIGHMLQKLDHAIAAGREL